MIDIIEHWESKNFRICIIPQFINKKWYWTTGVYVGEDSKANWVDSNNNLPRAAYVTYKEALDAAINYCNNYKKSKKK